MELAAGTRIAERYVVLGALGEGGMGVVLRARDERLGRAVAVKVLPPALIGDEAARKRLVREARSAAALDHPNIVHVYDVGELPDGGAFLVMELVKGKSLGEHLRNGTLSREQRLRAIVDVARALQWAHEQGFLHRDIKPDNVMAREDGRVVVLDFGLAKVVAPGLGSTVDASLVSSKSTFVGTPAYVSPEQARGETLDAKSDQFSLAVTAFELVTGELPWEGGTPLEVISHILRGEPKKARTAYPEASEELERALDRALSKRPGDRFESVAAFADAIEAAVPAIGQAPSLRDVGTGPTQSMTAAAIRTLSAPATAKRVTTARPSLWRTGAMALGALVTIAAALFVALHRPPGPAAAAPLDRSTVVACPMLHATDDLADAAWLGAAAATLVCGRVQALLGGDPTRTRVPAELLALPREPGEGFPIAPFDAPDAVDKTLARARTVGAFIDGTLEHTSEFHLVLALHAGGVTERGEARAATLVDAVAQAMAALVPRLESAVDEAYPSRWLAGTSVKGRLAMFDLHALVIVEDDDGQRAACNSLPPEEDLGTLAPFVAALCAQQLFLPLPAAPAFDATSAGVALTTASTLRFSPSASEEARRGQTERAARLVELAEHETDTGAKALLLAAAAEIDYQIADAKAAALAARTSIQASPKVTDVRGNAWHRQAFVLSDDVALLAAHAAWLPWEPYAQANLFHTQDRRDMRGYQRAHVLAQHGYWAVEHGVRLLERGDLLAGRGIAAATRNARLDVLVLHVERRPLAAFDAAVHALHDLPATPANGNLATRLAGNVLDLGALLDKPTTDSIADYVERFVVPNPPALTHGATTLFGAIAVCVQSSAALGERCIDRIATLFDSGYFGGGILSAANAIDGARRYLKRDFDGAARAWRTVTTPVLADTIRNPMAIAFERAGDLDLADRVDDPPVAAGLTAPNAELCYVRKALRADKRGDLATAQTLARTFVDRWDAADERPPDVALMKRLLSKK